MKHVFYSPSDWIRLGLIEREWGIRGECLVHFDNPHSPLPSTLTALHLGKLENQNGTLEMDLVSLDAPMRAHGRAWRAKLRGIDTPEQAKTYRGRVVYCPFSSLPSLEDGNYYWTELIGATVVDEAGRLLGTVSHLEGVSEALCLVIVSDDCAANDSQSDSAPSESKAPERLYPAHPDLIHAFDRATRRLIITDIW